MKIVIVLLCWNVFGVPLARMRRELYPEVEGNEGGGEFRSRLRRGVKLLEEGAKESKKVRQSGVERRAKDEVVRRESAAERLTRAMEEARRLGLERAGIRHRLERGAAESAGEMREVARLRAELDSGLGTLASERARLGQLKSMEAGAGAGAAEVGRELEELKMEVSNSAVQAQGVSEAIRRLQTEIQAAELEIEAATIENKGLEAERLKLDEEAKSLATQLADLERLESEISTGKQAVDSRLAKWRVKVVEIEKTRKQYEATLQALAEQTRQAAEVGAQVTQAQARFKAAKLQVTTKMDSLLAELTQVTASRNQLDLYSAKLDERDQKCVCAETPHPLNPSTSQPLNPIPIPLHLNDPYFQTNNFFKEKI